MVLTHGWSLRALNPGIPLRAPSVRQGRHEPSNSGAGRAKPRRRPASTTHHNEGNYDMNRLLNLIPYRRRALAAEARADAYRDAYHQAVGAWLDSIVNRVADLAADAVVA